MAKIIIKRKSSMLGCIQNHDVYFLNTFVGNLKSGGVLEIPVDIGIHRLSFNSTMKRGQINATFDVVVNEPDEIVELTTYFGMNSNYVVKYADNKPHISTVVNHQEHNVDIFKKDEGNTIVLPKSNNKSVGRNIAQGCAVSMKVFTLIVGVVLALVLFLPESEQSNNTTESEQSNNTTELNSQTNINIIEIPDVVGMDYETAMGILNDIDLEVTVDYTYTNTLKTNCNEPQDVVVSQSLQGKIEKENEIKIVVAKPAVSVEEIKFDINYVGGVDTTISFINKSDKQIAYIIFNVKYYDRMGNLAFCSIKNSPTARLKFTGPLNASQKDDAYWEAVIYNSSVAAIQPQTIEIIFTDGTSQAIENSGIYWHTSSYYGGTLCD